MELLTDAEKEYFRNFENMFNSPGWQQMAAEIKAEVSGTPESVFWSAKSFEELVFTRNRVRHLLTLLSYPEIMEQRRATLVSGRENAALEAEIKGRANV